MVRVNEVSHSFTCHPHVYPRMEWAILPLHPSRRAFWPILVSRPKEGRKLSWPGNRWVTQWGSDGRPIRRRWLAESDRLESVAGLRSKTCSCREFWWRRRHLRTVPRRRRAPSVLRISSARGPCTCEPRRRCRSRRLSPVQHTPASGPLDGTSVSADIVVAKFCY